MRVGVLISLPLAIWAALLTLLALPAAAQNGQYQTREEFLLETLGSESPESGVIWFDAELRGLATDILGHPPSALRMRYWYQDKTTAWVIDEIGKEKPITLGIVIEKGAIRELRVLQFRESRGWEIRYPFFTRQFARQRLNAKGALSQRVDGITGATLSVRAATRSATLALALDDYVQSKIYSIADAQ